MEKSICALFKSTAKAQKGSSKKNSLATKYLKCALISVWCLMITFLDMSTSHQNRFHKSMYKSWYILKMARNRLITTETVRESTGSCLKSPFIIINFTSIIPEDLFLGQLCVTLYVLHKFLVNRILDCPLCEGCVQNKGH